MPGFDRDGPRHDDSRFHHQSLNPSLPVAGQFQPPQGNKNMAINWTSVGSTLSGLTTALTAAGVSSTSMPSILQSIGLASNPNQSAEMAICSQLLQFTGNPAVENELVMKLVTEQGLPQSAAALAMTLTAPGTDIPSRVLEIEQLIKQGG